MRYGPRPWPKWARSHRGRPRTADRRMTDARRGHIANPPCRLANKTGWRGPNAPRRNDRHAGDPCRSVFVRTVAHNQRQRGTPRRRQRETAPLFLCLYIELMFVYIRTLKKGHPQRPIDSRRTFIELEFGIYRTEKPPNRRGPSIQGENLPNWCSIYRRENRNARFAAAHRCRARSAPFACGPGGKRSRQTAVAAF